LREFSEHVYPKAKRIAAEEKNYVLMAYNRFHYELEEHLYSSLCIKVFTDSISRFFSIPKISTLTVFMVTKLGAGVIGMYVSIIQQESYVSLN
jgi:hypothetical protein